MRDYYQDHIKKERTRQAVEYIRASEDTTGSILQTLVSTSNLMLNNSVFTALLADTSLSDYQKNKHFDTAVDQIVLSNIYDMDAVRIALLDSHGREYTNWSRKPGESVGLRQSSLVKRAGDSRGQVCWDFFSSEIKIEGRERACVWVARQVSDNAQARQTGVLLVGVEQASIFHEMERYIHSPLDGLLILNASGEIVFATNVASRFAREDVERLKERFGNLTGDYDVLPFLDESYLVTHYTLGYPWNMRGQGYSVYYMNNEKQIGSYLDQLFQPISVLLAVISASSLIILILISVNMVRPINLLAQKMSCDPLTSDMKGLDMARRDEIGSLNRSFRRMSARIRWMLRRQEQEYAVRERYRFESLRAQVNPHFLFNTLTSIRWMSIIQGAENITESIDALAKILKYSLARDSEIVPLERELQNVQDYIAIQNMRYAGMLTLKCDVSDKTRKRRVLKFILQPIVENAIIHGFSAGDKSGEIGIKAWEEGDCLEIEVSDNGRGIPSDSPILDAEFLSDQAYSTQKLTGLGLKNVNDRIKVEYGDECGIQVKSKEGEGTTIGFHLTLRKERIATIRLMIVDDEFLVRVGFQSIMKWEEHGYTFVAEATNGEEALAKVEQTSPDIVLVDLNMAPIDGFELIQKLQQRYPKIKEIVLSNYNDAENVRRAMKLGASDYIFKLTSNPQSLLATMEDVAREIRLQASESDTTQNEKDKLLVKNHSAIKSYLIRKALREGADNDELLLKEFESLHLPIRFQGAFRVFYLSIDNYNRLIGWCNSPKKSVRKLSLETAVESTLAESGVAETYNYDAGDLIAIVPETGGDACIKRLQAAYERLKVYTARYFGLHISACISMPCRDLNEFRQAVGGCERKLYQRLIDGGEHLYFDSQIYRDEIQKALFFVEEHYQEELNVQRLTAVTNLSESYFSHLFKKDVGINFTDYVIEIRIAKAKELLIASDMRINEIAEHVGLNNANYFSTLFRKQVGMSPLQYRNANAYEETNERERKDEP